MTKSSHSKGFPNYWIGDEWTGGYQYVICTDDERYGGFTRIDTRVHSHNSVVVAAPTGHTGVAFRVWDDAGPWRIASALPDQWNSASATVRAPDRVGV
jgi:hypothetical protein